MSERRYAVVVLTSGLKKAGLDADGVIEATKGTPLDETEQSLTLSMPDSKSTKAAVKALVQRGLKKDEDVFEVTAEIPEWLESYQEAASAMIEHGG